jgi:adenine-specific DNA-methyltransferase
MEPPRITGMESDPRHIPVLHALFGGFPGVRIVRGDFLEEKRNSYDYVIGNPPYVSIAEISPTERARFRGQFAAARGRFDLYLLFLNKR